ncbi:MAG: disulfide bond formation protein B [Octadecabacter sp.]|nr:disulfide bond formation protein B [Octadecabacter sp.]
MDLGIIAATGSASLLGGAWIFQALGYAPCAMCIWQRYPHGVAIAVGILVLVGLRHPIMYLIGAAAAGTTSALGLYHTGVERDWWEGPTSCAGTGLDLSNMSAADLLSTDTGPTIVLCDQVVWQFLTLSMASWNALISLALTGFWVLALRNSLRGSARPVLAD